MPITDLALPTITDIGADLLEMGSVRLGYKGPKGEPRKLQSFIICDRRMERVKLEGGKTIDRPMIRLDIMREIAKRQGIKETVKVGDVEVPKLIELDIFLVYDDPALNFFTYRGSYSASRILCKGFGKGTEAQRYNTKLDKYEPLPCPGSDCPWTYEGETAEHPGCKAHGVLSFVLKDDPMLGGTHVFRTTSVQSISAILGGMAAVARFTGGRLGGLPMRLRCVEAQSKAVVRGQTQTRKYTLATVGFAGDVRSMLDAAGAMYEARAKLSALGDEYEKRLIGKMRSGPGEADPDEVRQIAEEFHPVEQAADETEQEASQTGPALLPPAPEPAKPEAVVEAKPAGPAEKAEHDVLMVLIRAAVTHFGHVAKLREHLMAHEAGPWVQPSKADVETLRRYVVCLRSTGVVPPEVREPGSDDEDIPV